jgi:aryl-alcohol dehydrogenase-like predicted oxidoreductase
VAAKPPDERQSPGFRLAARDELCLTMARRNRLVLGTVQFGLPYGVSHEGGRVPAEEARNILELAAVAGIDMLDTAAAYGESEEILGAIVGAESPFAVVTKTLPIRAKAIDEAAIARIETSFRDSLRKLRRDKVYALLAHDPRDLLNPGGERLWALLETLKAQGLVGKIGASVYDWGEIDALTSRYPLDALQAPLNVFDQRLLADGGLARAAAKGVEIHARSVLLQGLLLMSPEAAAAKLPQAVEKLQHWRDALAEADVSPLAAALGFALQASNVDRIVLGVHSAAHLSECLAALEAAPQLDYARFASNDLDLIDPRRWSAPRPS